MAHGCISKDDHTILLHVFCVDLGETIALLGDRVTCYIGNGIAPFVACTRKEETNMEGTKKEMSQSSIEPLESISLVYYTI
jgi:hypothetical protein